MSESKHSDLQPTADAQPAFILVRPQLGENIGAAARAMFNFSLDRMRIVDPRDGWPNASAVKMASGAGRVLDNAELYPDVGSAVADCNYVYATTARNRDLNLPTHSPSEAALDGRHRIESGHKLAFLFGPERAGLNNDDLAFAQAMISVPTNPEFSSLNLAQCVLLSAYEWLRARSDPSDSGPQPSRLPPANSKAKEVLAQHYIRDLEEAGFFWPESKAEGMRKNLQRLLLRLDLTEPEVRTLHGVRKALKTGAGGGKG